MRKEIAKKLNNRLFEIRKDKRDKENSSKIDICMVVLRFFSSEDEEVRNICPYSDSRWEDNLDGYSRIMSDYEDKLFLILMAFVRELILFDERESFYNREKPYSSNDFLNLKTIWEKFCKSEYSIEPFEQELAEYIKKEITFDIVNSYIGKRDFQAFLNYEDTVIECQKEKIELESKVNKFKTETEELLSKR